MNKLQQPKIPVSLFWRNLLFTILQPGMVAGLIPWLLVRRQAAALSLSKMSVIQFAGVVVLAAGITIVLFCIYRFAVEGRGTLSPADPTRELVISGLYKYSRNPMYIGVMLILSGECLIIPATNLISYTVFIFLIFNLFIIFYEEPRLKKDFGERYLRYRKQVRRWL